MRGTRFEKQPLDLRDFGKYFQMLNHLPEPHIRYALFKHFHADAVENYELEEAFLSVLVDNY